MPSVVSQPYRNLSDYPTVIVSRLRFWFPRFWDGLLVAACTKWVKVSGPSMAPTIADGTWVRVDRRAYGRHCPGRFDVVLIEHPRRPGLLEVKRVVGLPGENVVLSAKGFQVDGVSVEQPLVPQWDGRGGEWNLGAADYVVLGDNRARSTDSREFGAVHKRHIKGRVVSRGVKP